MCDVCPNGRCRVPFAASSPLSLLLLLLSRSCLGFSSHADLSLSFLSSLFSTGTYSTSIGNIRPGTRTIGALLKY